ncbi:hypothetical protein THAOC_32736 [Thalassiosira oceanica]|uniref:Uncharacterized protein n=1 Tax=Thalassiosira oceanica TaxID=159749 RepID=K0R5B2_THAOC|nr:hypothetical protein THAOC_32736 [Thalassiosira oceanica]|eukprot:EJK48463.1 hypothetical protein THAOC_32736 [Thalassiosira oceanica]
MNSDGRRRPLDDLDRDGCLGDHSDVKAASLPPCVRGPPAGGLVALQSDGSPINLDAGGESSDLKLLRAEHDAPPSSSAGRLLPSRGRGRVPVLPPASDPRPPEKRSRRKGKDKGRRTETASPTGWVTGPYFMEFRPKEGRGSYARTSSGGVDEAGMSEPLPNPFVGLSTTVGGGGRWGRHLMKEIA